MVVAKLGVPPETDGKKSAAEILLFMEQQEAATLLFGVEETDALAAELARIRKGARRRLSAGTVDALEAEADRLTRIIVKKAKRERKILSTPPAQFPAARGMGNKKEIRELERFREAGDIGLLRNQVALLQALSDACYDSGLVAKKK